VASGGSSSGSNRDYLLLGGVLAATALVYLRCLGNGFVWDDLPLIVLNPYLSQWSFIWKSLTRHEYWFSDPTNTGHVSRYRPVLLLWMALNYHLSGVNPAGWHVAGVVSHLIGVWLVFRIAVRLTQAPQAALLAALFFALLPVHAEAVVWSAAAGSMLSSALAMAAFDVYISSPGVRGRKRLLAPIFFAAAMLTHEMAATFPALIWLYAFLLEPSGDAPSGAQRAGVAIRARAGRATLRMAPFVAVLFLYFLVRRFVLGFWMSNPSDPPNSATAAQVLMTIPWALTTYFSGIAIPRARFFHNRVLLVTTPASPHFYFPLAALAVLGVAFLWAIRNHPRRRLYLFCAGWVLVALAPMMDLFAFPDDTLVPDGYAYLASVGWCLLAADWLDRRGRRTPMLRVTAGAAGLALAAAYGVALWKAQYFFHDGLTLFTSCVRSFPESFHCHDQLADLLRQQGDTQGSEREMDAALKLHPADAVALYDKGMFDARQGRTNAAERELETALALMSRVSPPPPTGYVALAELYDADGDQARAEAVLDHARSLPEGAEAVQMARARLRMRHGDPAGAEKILRDLVTASPGQFQQWTMLGLLMLDEKRYPEAADAFARAVSLAPGDLRSHLFNARALHLLARDPEALEQCRQALAIDPGNPGVQQLRDQITAAAGRP
jgi:protein O-mannosyl-transferase